MSAMSATLVASESAVGHKTLITHLTIPWTDSEGLCPVHVIMHITVTGVKHKSGGHCITDRCKSWL